MGGGLGRGDDLGPELVALCSSPRPGLIHERPPLSRQSELWESFKEESFREDL